MKTLTLIFVGILVSVQVYSQVFEWIQGGPVNYNFNPSYPTFPVDFDETNDRIIHARLDSFAYIYGSSLVGKSLVESRDTNGAVIWQFQIGDIANVQRIVADQSGNIIIGGQFRETLRLPNNDSLAFINVGFNGWNFYLLKVDLQGNLVWKRNLSQTWPFYDGIEALAISPSSVCWYALTDFFTAKIVSIDSNGNDVITHTIDNGKTIGNISFDPSGGMYISGGAEIGNFIMDADTFVAANQYNMFIARFNSQGQPAWAYFGNDITFQRPMITTDPSGNVFYAGMRFDSTSFNGFFIPQPLPFGDFFGFKADTSGNVLWAVRQPQLLIGPFGVFNTGSNLFVDADAQGNFYMGGIQQGFVDWGNGYVSSTSGFSDHKVAVAQINESGSTQWVKIGGSNQSNYLHALAVSDNGSCYFTGSFGDTATFDNIFIPNTNFYNFMLGKIRVLSSGIPDFYDDNLFSVFPNPATEFIMTDEKFIGSNLSIYEITGRMVINEKRITSNKINISALAPGSYFLRIEDGKNNFNTKFLKVN